MSLNVLEIENTADDEKLFHLLGEELMRTFPPEVQRDRSRHIAAIEIAPRGLRAMAGIYELDVSMALDDLAWHFLNQTDDFFRKETLNGLVELGANEAAEIFLSAWEIMRPHAAKNLKKPEDWSEHLRHSGTQGAIDPLNDRLWTICKAQGKSGLLHYWISYARKFPERCVSNSAK